MAILRSGSLGFDFRYTGFSNGWVQYQFYFLWDDKPIVRNEILERTPGYRSRRPESAFLANDCGGDRFIPFLKEVLDSEEPDYWEPMEPDIVVAVYPGNYFPFLKSHWTLVHESEEAKNERQERMKSKAEMGKLPDDDVTLIAFVDACNFKDADAYYGQGLSLQMIVKRHEIMKFIDDLECEYSEFRKTFKVDEWIEADESGE